VAVFASPPHDPSLSLGTPSDATARDDAPPAAAQIPTAADAAAAQRWAKLDAVVQRIRALQDALQAAEGAVGPASFAAVVAAKNKLRELEVREAVGLGLYFLKIGIGDRSIWAEGTRSRRFPART
jgi:hypothetical protein